MSDQMLLGNFIAMFALFCGLDTLVYQMPLAATVFDSALWAGLSTGTAYLIFRKR